MWYQGKNRLGGGMGYQRGRRSGRTDSGAWLDQSQGGQRCCRWECENLFRDGSRKWARVTPESQPLPNKQVLQGLSLLHYYYYCCCCCCCYCYYYYLLLWALLCSNTLYCVLGKRGMPNSGGGLAHVFTHAGSVCDLRLILSREKKSSL